MDNIIQDFQNQLTKYVPSLKLIDEDWGQCDFYDDRPPVKFPCALIDIQDATFSDAGEGRQQGVLTVCVKLFVLRLGNTSNAAPDSQRKSVRDGWLACNQIIKAVHNKDFLSEGYAPPKRARMERIKRRDGIYERNITFTIGITDRATVESPQKARATVSLSASLEEI